MTDEKRKRVVVKDAGPWGWIFLWAFIGAAVYFVQHADGFWGVIWALVKAAVWPAYVLHAVLGLLHL